MKSTLTFLSFATAIGTVATLALEFAGRSVPHMLSYSHLFGGFVASTVLLIVHQDYSPSRSFLSKPAGCSTDCKVGDRGNAVHPLAA